MLPDHVNIILLSATVPNTKEFADWVGRVNLYTDSPPSDFISDGRRRKIFTSYPRSNDQFLSSITFMLAVKYIK